MIAAARHLRALAGLTAMAVLVACGGGGGGGGADEGVVVEAELLPAPLPALADVTPGGARIDVSDRDYFPLHVGDQWQYDRLEGGVTVAGAVTRNVVASTDAVDDVVIEERDSVGNPGADAIPDRLAYRTTPEGLMYVDPFAARGVWPGLHAALPTYLEYPTPFYAAGSEREVNRHGSLGVDLDFDGQHEGFRVQIKQVFQGLETLVVMGQPTEVAHFTNTVTVTVARTAADSGGDVAAITTEQAYFASGLGLVRVTRSGKDADGTVFQPVYTLSLRQATINGVAY